MSNMMSFEVYVDTTMSCFFDQLRTRFVQTGKACDLGIWLQWFAFDFMGEITFSKRLGFLERAEDVGNITANIWKYFQKASPISQIPWVDLLWEKNPIYQHFKMVTPNPVVQFGIERVQERQNEDEDDNEGQRNGKDFLSRFLGAIKKDPTIPPFALTAWTTSNVTAGSDTTAILLRTIFHSLLTHPQAMDRLMDEIDTAYEENSLSNPVTWKQARELPYLDAVIKESGRVHPPFGLHLERVVPLPGAIVCGKWLPAGTVVGMSGWAVHHDPDTFGSDSHEWKPERWLDATQIQRRDMEHALLTVSESACLITY
jgi:hypothetical protein